MTSMTTAFKNLFGFTEEPVNEVTKEPVNEVTKKPVNEDKRVLVYASSYWKDKEHLVKEVCDSHNVGYTILSQEDEARNIALFVHRNLVNIGFIDYEVFNYTHMIIKRLPEPLFVYFYRGDNFIQMDVFEADETSNYFFNTSVKVDIHHTEDASPIVEKMWSDFVIANDFRDNIKCVFLLGRFYNEVYDEFYDKYSSREVPYKYDYLKDVVGMHDNDNPSGLPFWSNDVGFLGFNKRMFKENGEEFEMSSCVTFQTITDFNLTRISSAEKMVSAKKINFIPDGVNEKRTIMLTSRDISKIISYTGQLVYSDEFKSEESQDETPINIDEVVKYHLDNYIKLMTR